MFIPRTMNRRYFGRIVSATASGLLLPVSIHAAEPGASDLIQGKDKRLKVLSSDPIVLETPLDLLAKGRITPTELLFVRNNQMLDKAATLEPLKPKEKWKIDLTGVEGKRLWITHATLAKLPMVEYEMVLQCSGNGRALFAQAVKTSGTQWGQGGIGNVRFRGVTVASVLKHLDVQPDPNARFVTAEGRDDPPPMKIDFEHSLDLEEVLEKSILALVLNGKPLPAIHGGPVRLVTPGHYATMHVKWLSRLRFEKDESTNYNHLPRYRTPNRLIKPGSEFDFTLTNSTPTARMKVSSIILGMSRDSKNRAVFDGVAFNDGTARIDSVVVSPDKGATWHRAELERPKSPYAWTRWRWTAPADQTLTEVWARAVDALGRTQPLDGTVFWNPRGYQWNGVAKFRVTP